VLSLDDRTWRTVDLPDELQDTADGRRDVVGATADGRAIFVLGGSTFAPASGDFWAYDVAGKLWAQLPDPATTTAHSCLTDDTLVVVSRQGPAERPHVRVLDLTDPGAGWAETVPIPDRPGRRSSLGDADALCLDDRVLVHGPLGNRAYLHSTDVGSVNDPWAEVQPFDASAPAYLWTGDDLLLVGGGEGDAPVARYDLEAGEWVEIGSVADDLSRLTWTGSVVVGWPLAGGSEPVVVDLR
jgi:hypothetical protein